MKVKYDEYIIKCSYKELILIRTSLRTLEYDYKTHRFSNYKEHSEVGKLIKKIGNISLNNAKVIDASGKIVLPGVIDTQVHF